MVKRIVNIVFCVRFLWLLTSIPILLSVSLGFEHISGFENSELHLFLLDEILLPNPKYVLFKINIGNCPLIITKIYMSMPQRNPTLSIWIPATGRVNWLDLSSLILVKLVFNFFWVCVFLGLSFGFGGSYLGISKEKFSFFEACSENCFRWKTMYLMWNEHIHIHFTVKYKIYI